MIGHPFAPLTFYDKDGRNPILTDWCGHLDGEEVCGQLAGAHPGDEELDPRDFGGGLHWSGGVSTSERSGSGGRHSRVEDLSPEMAVAVLTAGLSITLTGAGWWLWLADLAVPATVAALLVLYSAVSAVSARPSGVDGQGRRAAAGVVFRAPAAAHPHKLGVPPEPVHTSAVLASATTGGTPG